VMDVDALRPGGGGRLGETVPGSFFSGIPRKRIPEPFPRSGGARKPQRRKSRGQEASSIKVSHTSPSD